MTAPRRGLLVYNPAAGGRDRTSLLRGVAERARERGLDLTLLPTERPGHATELLRERLGEAPDLVVVSGGDGTVAEAAAALAGTSVPLALLPVGTANVVARELGIPRAAGAAEAVLRSGARRTLTTWPVLGRTSVLGVGVGYDARVMARVAPRLKRLFGRAGIGGSAVLEWLRYEFPPLEVSGLDAEGRPFEAEATAVFSGNTGRYGGEPILSPFADPGDALLELVLFTSRRTRDLLRFYAGLAGGRAAHLRLPFVTRRAVASFQVRSRAGYEVEVQVDGDVAGTTPVAVGPAGPPVQVVVPEAGATGTDGDGARDG